MREFFRGWRRKFGLLTLVMACVFTAGWVRNLVMSDLLEFPTPWRQQFVYLGNGGIIWMGYSRFGRDATWEYRSALTATQAIENRAIDEMYLDVPPGNNWRVWRFPYWSIVTPLTALSAFLLLRVQRPAKRPDEAKVTHA